MNNLVIAITGPTGAGKSTVAEMLAKQLENCVNIDADHIKHMIVNGFYKDETNPGGWSFNQWGLVGDSIGLLAANFQKKGFNVVINGYIDEPGWTAIEKHIQLTHKFLLLPALDINIMRDKARNEDVAMGEASVAVHHEHFSDSETYESFIKIDSANHTSEETVEEIKKML